ncbi:methyltransferase-like protein [Methylophaga frappieri]|uniref:Methyltransferase-like protein n=1 Tax=Methylophaga frappieri (strain ATCC BAA-2434 / DSM 25690 / JAM7) TaxID=754477 RepID=I1YE60_METFJ|nr:class I SAM-dependent methyltransferase [Methylophaga frappieri]AFJ01203.1 methyltransferase-like protein [Methylophaga frappieri]
MSVSFCRLCHSPVSDFFTVQKRHYEACLHCHAVQLDVASLPTPAAELALYQTHQNEVDDPRYQAFTAPVTTAILERQKSTDIGLDFGAGPGPVVAHQLTRQGYQIIGYDPFFQPDKIALSRQYDFIICCEVMEHFHHPAESFALLRKLLKPGGVLYCMTSLFHEQLDFKQWHYKNDATHAFFYHQQSLHWIRDQIGFRHLENDQKLILFSR